MDFENKSIEEWTLTTVTWDKDFKKYFKKWDKYGKYEEPVLIDECQYWKKKLTIKDKRFFIMLRYIVRTRGWELSLWDREALDEDNHPYCAFHIVCEGIQLETQIKNMWMSTQHLRLDFDDDRNICWDYHRCLEWWRAHTWDKGITFKIGKPEEHPLHYFEED